MAKRHLAYSQLTDNVYIVDPNGVRTDVSQNFIQTMLLWFHETSDLQPVGKKWERSLRVNGDVKWKFTIERVSE